MLPTWKTYLWSRHLILIEETSFRRVCLSVLCTSLRSIDIALSEGDEIKILHVLDGIDLQKVVGSIKAKVALTRCSFAATPKLALLAGHRPSRRAWS